MRVPPPDEQQVHAPVIMLDVHYVSDRKALEERFGRWPSFHDAEVQAVRLDSGQRTDGRPSVELDIHLFASDGIIENGRLRMGRHTLATSRFEGAEAIELDGFGRQHVLDDLEIHHLGETATTAARLLVDLPSNNGLGGSFRCQDAIVIAVSDFQPAPHSVYHDH
jgi:hypothetical protein